MKTLRLMLVIGTALAVPVAVCQGEPQSHGQSGGEIGLFWPDQIKWGDGPPSLPAGAKLAVLEGDPAKEGPFVMRLRLPDGYRIPPHVHPKAERITVISGTFNVGMGNKFDLKAGRALVAGTFGTWPAGMKHFVWASGDTVIQLHGTGPWEIKYLNPADDPRGGKE